MSHCAEQFHRCWDEADDDLFERGKEILKMGFKAFAYSCPDCKKERHAFFSEDAWKYIVESDSEMP